MWKAGQHTSGAPLSAVNGAIFRVLPDKIRQSICVTLDGISDKCKGRVVPVPHQAQRHEDAWGLTSALREGEWSASRPGRFTPNEE